MNAWASYEKTAKEARTLNHGTREVTYTRQQYPRELRHRLPSQSHHSIQLSDLSGHGEHYRLYSSHKNLMNVSSHKAPLGLSMSRHSAVLTPNMAAASKNSPTTSGFFETLQTEKSKSPRVSVDMGEQEEPKEELDDKTLDVIRDTFPIFFEDPVEAKKDRPIGIKSFFASINATMPWQYDAVDSVFLKFLSTCLRGIGQVYFQNNPVSGLLILMGMFLQSSRIAVHGIIALVSGTSVALLLGFDVGLARSGLFGYNPYLVGLAIATFDGAQDNTDYNPSILISTIVFSSLAPVVFVMLGKLLVPYKSPPLTLPFNLVTILFIAASANMNRIDFNPVVTPALPDYESPPFDGITVKAFFAGTIRGVGQVFLADNVVSGVLVLLGIAVCSRISAVAAFTGSALGAATALAVGVPGSAIELGMFGFNASLSVTAMFMFYSPSIGAGVLATMAGVATVFTQQALATMLEPFGLPFLTLPFCLVGLPFIIIQGTTSIVVAVPLSSMTIPEDHFRTVSVLEDGFSFLKECLDTDTERPRRLSRARSREMTKSLSRLNVLISETDREADEGNKVMKRFFCFIGTDPDAEIKASALALFKKLDINKMHSIHIDDVVKVLQQAGLVDKESLHFARLILDLVDSDESLTIDKHEFVAFAVVGASIDTIRHQLLKFFAFVDEDGNGKVAFDEINHGLEYLGQPRLTAEESDMLLELTHTEGDEIDVIDLLNVLTIAKMTSLVDAFHSGAAFDSTSKDGIATSKDGGGP